MSYGVFVHRADSIYKDVPAERYQFPRPYLRRVEACVGDWIVYYEPRKVPGTKGYFAVAKVDKVVVDPSAPSMFLALIAPGTYLDFAHPVPFSTEAGLIEQGLLNEEGAISGRAQAAVRLLSPLDFARIIDAGLAERAPLLPRVGGAASAIVQEPEAPFVFDQPRDRVLQISSRPVRDRVFRRLVLDAYSERCAVTGLKLINGGGRAEVEAAHIRPVEANGPDSLNNGLALSGTAHWMFDRGLISLSDDMEVLVSRQANDPDGIRSIINSSGRALTPDRPGDRPHPLFLQWHRSHCFKH